MPLNLNKYFLLVVTILVIFLVTTITTAKYFHEKYINEKIQKENSLLLLGDKNKELEVYKNKYDNLVTRNETAILDTKAVKELIENGNLKWLKEFEGLKKNLKNLEVAYNVQIQLTDSLRSKINFFSKNYVNEKGDTIPFSAFKWEYKDEWGQYSLNQITPDSVEFKRNENIPLSGVILWDRKWFLGKKKYWSEVTSPNPFVKITESTNIKIQKYKNGNK